MAVNDALREDLDFVLGRTPKIWGELRRQRLLITGGTGFFGTWLLETINHANLELGSRIKTVVLARNTQAFAEKHPEIMGREELELLEGDVRTFSPPPGEFSHVIHAAMPASAATHRADPILALDVGVQGTKRVLEFARKAGTRKLLFTSSGAIYGGQPANLPRVPETYVGAFDPLNSAHAYAEGKRISELMLTLYHQAHGLDAKIARCFTFAGPYLPLHANFAVSDFIREGLAGRDLIIAGDGRPHRSYLYGSDLMVWLLNLLQNGKAATAYNVGSEELVTIADLARMVAEAFTELEGKKLNVIIRGEARPGQAEQYYAPCTLRARTELGLRQEISLAEGIRKTIRWHRLTQRP